MPGSCVSCMKNRDEKRKQPWWGFAGAPLIYLIRTGVVEAVVVCVCVGGGKVRQERSQDTGGHNGDNSAVVLFSPKWWGKGEKKKYVGAFDSHVCTPLPPPPLLLDGGKHPDGAPIVCVGPCLPLAFSALSRFHVRQDEMRKRVKPLLRCAAAFLSDARH